MFQKILIGIVLSTFFLSFHTNVYALNGVLKKHPTNPRYFTDNSGKAIYLTGSHTWRAFQEEIPIDGTAGTYIRDYAGFLTKLQNWGHNSLRLWTTEHFRLDYGGGPADVTPNAYQRTGPGNAKDGKMKFDLTKYNQAYFDRLRQRVVDAGQRNIYVSIMLFEGHALRGSNTPWRWDGHPYNPVNNINLTSEGVTNTNVHTTQFSQVVMLQKAYIRKVIDTVNDLDNVMYEIINEGSYSSNAWQYEMINYIKQYESTKPKQHPVGMTSRAFGSPDSDIFNSPADWVSPANAEHKTNPPAGTGSKIIISDTDHLWGTGGDRAWVWKSFTRGLHTWYMDDYLMDGKPSGDLQTPRAMGLTNSYAKKMNLANMTPQSNKCSTTYCLIDDGKEYLIYDPNAGGTFTVTLQAGTYQYEWLNAGSGNIHSSGTVTVPTAVKSFTTPFANDAVLYLKAQGTSTPTNTIPTPTTVQPTITSSNTEKSFSLSLFLHGIGKGGDNVNPTSSGNNTPVRSQRTVALELYDTANQLVATKNGTIAYIPASGDFKGQVSIGGISNGSYTGKIIVAQYLKKTIPGIITIASSSVSLPQISLISGDVTGDNKVNISDYNFILDCFSDLTPARNCADANKKLLTDLTDDGNVNQFDYNLFLRELSVQSGE